MKQKHVLFLALIPLLFAVTIPMTMVDSRAEEVAGEDFVAHEWGTFTTLHSSQGQRLSGLERAEEVLPQFVYAHGYEASNKVPRQPKAAKNYSYATKGGYYFDANVLNIRPVAMHDNVTVKMETPVIYFYSDEAREVKVRADFPQGSINEWYPSRTAGEENQGKHDFANPYNGWIEWDTKVLAKDDKRPLTPLKSLETPQWTAPRVPGANNVMVNGEIENFLFYRGMANFDIPLKFKFDALRQLRIFNPGKLDIPYLLVYERTKDGQTHFWWSGDLNQNTGVIVDAALTPKRQRGNLQDFERELVKAGLYPDEAKAMLKTWDNSYFQHEGFKVFWIVPEQLVDELLPLAISPRPKELKRVFVGRADIMTPEFEQQMLGADFNINNLAADRYFTGYKARFEQLKAEN